MGTQSIRLRPGIDIEQTPVLNEAGFSGCQLIRFRDGLPEKRGGWLHLNSQPIVGTGRGMWSWADLSEIPYVAVGTEQRLQLYVQGTVYDITPLRQTDNVAVSFSTTIGSPIVQIKDASNGASVGDWLEVNVPVAVGGLVVQGFQQVTDVIDANDYHVTLPSNATANVTNGGAVPTFTTTTSSAVVTVTLAAHGLTAGASFPVQVSTTVGGTTVAANTYTVQAPVTANQFAITVGSAASSGATVAENSGNAQLIYLIPTGFASATPVTGYGIGGYGVGSYGGSGSGSVISPLREWFLNNWGQDLLGNYNGSPLYVWVPPIATGNVAIPINTTTFPGALDPPTIVNFSMVAAQQQIAICFGVDAFGTGEVDPNLIRWSDISDFTDWEALTSNQAGSFRLPTGSGIVGAIQAGNFIYIWTNVDMWSMSYIGTPFIFSFQKIAAGTNLIAPAAVGIYESVVFWCGNQNFYLYDGSSVQIIPCPVWDAFFRNLNRQQVNKVFAAVNSWFSEVTWYYPSASGGGEVDSYVTYNIREQVWDLGVLTTNGYVRTCWVDTNVLGAPIGVDLNGLLQQHEESGGVVLVDADGTAMTASVTTGFAALSEGNERVFVERIIMDLIVTGGIGAANRVFISPLVADYPSDVPVALGPFQWQPSPTGPQSISLHSRQGLLGFNISSSDLGVFWRLGNIRYIGAPAGRL